MEHKVVVPKDGIPVISVDRGGSKEDNPASSRSEGRKARSVVLLVEKVQLKFIVDQKSRRLQVVSRVREDLSRIGGMGELYVSPEKYRAAARKAAAILRGN